jgi:ribosomal protein L20A (L18A)
MKFIVEGTMMVSGQEKAFVKEIEAASKKRAEELATQKIGADHKLKRSQIKIAKIGEWKE